MDTSADSQKEQELGLNGQKESEKLQALKDEIDQLKDPEEKLIKTISLMELSLSLTGKPCFKTFWDAREQCLLLFKETISPQVRAIQWEKYCELTKQARLLKDHFAEESTFAVEQVEMAVSALEKEISETSTHLHEVTIEPIPSACETLRAHRDLYQEIQKELVILNAQASRINSLRKELANMKMRVRKKSLLFQRLSEAGDRVIPRRKQLIQEISARFQEDVEHFVTTYFSKKTLEKPTHLLREEIKTLQAVAKQLPINSQVFTDTRMKLSECWDKLKEVEKEQKKQHAEKRELFKKNTVQIREKIKLFSDQFASGGISTQEAQYQLDAIFREMKGVELGREEVRALKEEIQAAKTPFLEKVKEEEKRKRQFELEKEEKRQRSIKEIEESITLLNQKRDETKSADLFEEIRLIQEKIVQLQLTDFEKESLVRTLASIENAAFEKSDRELELPADPKEATKLLQEALSKKQQRRAAIKEQLEKYRKICGGSGLGFEQSLHYNQQIAVEKERYEKICSQITDLESRLTALSE